MKKKKNKQLIQLCVLAGVLVVLVAALLVARYLNAQAEKAAEVEAIEVPYLEDATTLVLNNGTDEETYVYDAEDDTWHWAEDENFPLNSNNITAILNTWSALDTETELEISDELSAYGLEPAECSATITTDDGESLTILIGIATGDYYYCMIDGGESIYLISSTMSTYLNYSLYDMATLETFPSTDSDSLETITVQGAVETSFYQEITETTTTDDDGEETTETESAWYTTDGTNVTDADDLTELTSEVIGLGFDAMVNYYPTEDDLAEAGLDEPQCIVTVTYTTTVEDDDDEDDEDAEAETVTESFTLEIGNQTEDGSYYYATINGGTTIYQISFSDLSTIMAVAESGADALYADDE